jgi:N-carbamoylputrescine amidase
MVLIQTKVLLLLLQQTKVSNNEKLNIKNSINKIKLAAKKKAKIICLPELFLSPYFCQTESHSKFKLAEKIPGKKTILYCELAKKLSVVLIIPLFEKKTSGFYHNTSIIINEKGKIISKYRKMHIPDDPGYYEKFYFTPGDLGFKSTKTKYAKIGSLICWDQWFPEAARLTVLKGAEILFYPTAIGWHPKEKKKFGKSQLDAWIVMQRSHAIANGVFVAAINRTGLEKIGNKKIQFWGNSMIIDPSGNIVARAKSEKEDILICDINLNKIENVRNHWPFLRDRRIDYYKGLTKNPKDE